MSATIKHFLGNNSEVDRHHTSSDIDERTMREIYLPAFEAAVKEAHVGALMTSYNLVNGLHMTENAALVDGLVKKEWGFDGVVMSDWDATYDGVAAANAGLDIEMPSAKFMNRETLLPAIKAGKVSQATIDDKVRRILRTAIRFGWLDRPAVDASLSLYSEEGRAVALDAARAGLVLLKNDGELLPLDRKKLKTVALIGPNAYPAIPVGGGSAQVRPLAATSFVQGLADALRGSATVLVHHGVPTLAEIFDATDFVTAPPTTESREAGTQGRVLRRSGARRARRCSRASTSTSTSPGTSPTSGRRARASSRRRAGPAPSSRRPRASTASPPSATASTSTASSSTASCCSIARAGRSRSILRRWRSRRDRPYAIRFEYLHGDHHARVGLGVRRADAFVDPAVKELAARADVVVVAAGFEPMTESEGYDRTFQLPAGQDELIAAVRAANKRVVVALTSGGGVDMTRFIDHVPAVIETWYPGQEGGTALAEVLLGDVNPSGKLPVTFERRFEDSAVAASYYPDADKKIAYKEGVFLGYRHFDKTGAKPLFPFGHGLSYTRFKYGALTVTPEVMTGDAPVTVSFDVTNVGKRRGAEIAQLYVGDRHAPVPRPPKELKGFAKVELAPGETKRVQLLLDRRALSYFDVATKKWRAEPGTFELLVGSSSQRIELTGKLVLK